MDITITSGTLQYCQYIVIDLNTDLCNIGILRQHCYMDFACISKLNYDNMYTSIIFKQRVVISIIKDITLSIKKMDKSLIMSMKMCN